MKDPATLAKEAAAEITTLFGGNGLSTKDATIRTELIIEELLRTYASDYADIIVEGMRDSGY
jgi:hypothetical protein